MGMGMGIVTIMVMVRVAGGGCLRAGDGVGGGFLSLDRQWLGW